MVYFFFIFLKHIRYDLSKLYYLLKKKKKRNAYLFDTLTSEELLHRSYQCLGLKDLENMRTMNLKLELFNTDNQIVQTDGDVLKAFEKRQLKFKAIWKNEGKKKLVKNALVVMIAISEYNETTPWPNLKNVKNCLKKEMKFTFVYNKSPKMNKEDVEEFLDGLAFNYKLRKNTNQYDGFIVILCGHGDDGNVLVTSEGSSVSIDKIRSSFNCHEMESLQDCPKIFIIDACRGRNKPISYPVVFRGFETSTKAFQMHGHNDDGFLTIWSTTKGHVVSDSSLLSEHMKGVITEFHKKNYTFNQMLHQIRDRIRKSKSGEWYCVESQDTTNYDIIFAANSST
ncbi:hypothetical protein RFI_18183 [Reticulomyxa filosa]|uniref:Caspase family p20 domain-containing protein n=1 Tax=Reticulomyxa filosa TaxID=46433 RepID=X6N151_RETFI|nr:hypothetical protein RFI_18183 [Reticulomyxa filosa]|eukprot:ETO19057.1 hypothetical protein RFI_18183 [Reticulomyxa filosa]